MSYPLRFCVIYKNPENIQVLLRRCSDGEAKAQLELFQRYGPLMKAVCRRYLYESSEISPVLNQAFLVIFEKIGTYRFEGSFEGWMRKLVVRQCLNANQKKKPIWQSLEEADELVAEDVDLEGADLENIQVAIAQLPEGFRIIFNLYEIEGFKHHEIAKELNISLSTSRSQLARAKKILRDKLKDLVA